MTECQCNDCKRVRKYTTYALVFALSFAVGVTAAAWLQRLGVL